MCCLPETIRNRNELNRCFILFCNFNNFLEIDTRKWSDEMADTAIDTMHTCRTMCQATHFIHDRNICHQQIVHTHTHNTQGYDRLTLAVCSVFSTKCSLLDAENTSTIWYDWPYIFGLAYVNKVDTFWQWKLMINGFIGSACATTSEQCHF